MARSAILLIVAAALVASVCGARDTTREIAVSIPFRGTSVVDMMEYVRLRDLCAAIRQQIPRVLLCQIFEVTVGSGTDTAAVTVKAYLYTVGTATTDVTPAIISAAFPTTNAVTAGNSSFTRAAVGTAVAPAIITTVNEKPFSFTPLTVHVLLYYSGLLSNNNPVALADVVTKLDLMPGLVTQNTTDDGSGGAQTINGSAVNYAMFRVDGYFDDTNTFITAIRTFLTNSSVAPTINVLALAPASDAFNVYDTFNQAVDAINPNDQMKPAYPLEIQFITTLTGTGLTDITGGGTTFLNALYERLFPLTENAIVVAASTGTYTSDILVTIPAKNASDVVTILQQVHDLSLTGTVGGVPLTGVRRFGIDFDATPNANNKGNSFRIPTGDFTLEQKYTIGIDSFTTFLANGRAVNSICGALLERLPTQVAECKIHNVLADTSGSAPAARDNSGWKGVGRKYAVQAVDAQVGIVLTATNAENAAKLRTNLLAALALTNQNNFQGVALTPTIQGQEWRSGNRTQITTIATRILGGSGNPPPSLSNLDSVTSRAAFAATIDDQDTQVFFGKNDSATAPAGSPAGSFDTRAWIEAPMTLVRSALGLGARFNLAAQLITFTDVTVGVGYSVEIDFLVTTSPTGGFQTASGTPSLQQSWEDAIAALFTTETSVVLLTDKVAAFGTGAVLPTKIFALTEADIVTVMTQLPAIASRVNIETTPITNLQAPGVRGVTFAPALSGTDFPGVPMTPAPTPATRPATPVVVVPPPTTPVVTSPLAPIFIPPGAISASVVNAVVVLVVPNPPPPFNASALCEAFLAQSTVPIVRCVVIESTNLGPAPARGTAAKFQEQDVLQRVVVQLTAPNPAAAATLLDRLQAAIARGEILGNLPFSVFSISATALTPSPAPTPLQPGTPAAAPSATGEFITADIYIVILGNTLDAAGQAAVNNDIANILGGGSTATTRNVEQTTAARKMTTQASALRLTETVRAPSATYPSALAIVTRLQTGIRNNNNRLGGQTVVSVSAVPTGGNAAAGTGPAVLAMFAAVIVALLSALLQF